ncbi:MAG: hypothetical protein KKE20_06720, partial [Nanoarchaeota archaeon]|nr:hypothetical protein [Nanoarchaeota archaeon]
MKAEKMLLFTIMMIILSGSVIALGISPGRTDVAYDEGKPLDIMFNIINNENKNMRLLVYAEGEYSKQVEISRNTLEMSSTESMAQFNVRVNMIGEMKKHPGRNKIDIKVMQLPEDTGTGKGEEVMIGSTIEVVHQIWINVPYPGKYAEVPEVYITTPQNQNYALFTLPVYNRGREDLDDIRAVLEIYDPYGELKNVVDTGILALKAGGEGKLEARVYAEQRGRYKARITLYYADQQAVIEKEFFIGTEIVEVQGVTVDKFTLGQIAKFNLILENLWNQKMTDIYADVEITDHQNRQMTKFKTSSIDLEANSAGIINAYWDTENADPGTYNMHVILNYAKLFTERWFVMDVGFDSIRIRGGTTGAVTAEQAPGKGSISGILLIALLAVNML